MLREQSTRQLYYNWLVEFINLRSDKGIRYSRLVAHLHAKKFRWFVPNDDNRAFEGKNLRENFCREEGLDYSFIDLTSDCSMLELIVSLAFRCESMAMVDNRTINDWFWEMISNVGLDKCHDARPGIDAEIVDILDRIIERKYDKYGNGGFFPLKSPKSDQRKVELWYQMCHYLVENYTDVI